MRGELPLPAVQPAGKAQLGDARDLIELFRALYVEAARIMDATVFLFALYDEASQTVQVVRQMDRGVEHPGGSFPLGKGFTSEVIRTRSPRLVRFWSAEGPPVRLLYGTRPRAGRAAIVVVSRSCPRAGARRALCAELSTASLRDADLLGLGAIAVQAGTVITGAHDGADGPGARTNAPCTRGRPLEHD